MRAVLLIVVAATALAACQPNTEPPTTPPPPQSPAAAGSDAGAPDAAPDALAAAPAPAAPEIPEIPVGHCGPQDGLPEGERVANTVRWTTASEQDSFGFDVFRGDSEDGGFERLNSDPILGAGTTDETHRYSYRDERIDPCQEYWYYVEGIDTDGTREKLTPVFRAPPKHRAAGGAEAGDGEPVEPEAAEA